MAQMNLDTWYHALSACPSTLYPCPVCIFRHLYISIVVHLMYSPAASIEPRAGQLLAQTRLG